MKKYLLFSLLIFLTVLLFVQVQGSVKLKNQIGQVLAQAKRIIMPWQETMPAALTGSVLSSQISLGLQMNPAGSPIDFNSLDILKLPANIQNQLKVLPQDQQSKLNAELQQMKAEITSKGALWTAGFNAKAILTDTQKKNITGLLGEPNPASQSGSGARNVSGAGTTPIPDFFDWRSVGGKNYITSVKDQGQCGSCWAFGAVATLEGEANAYYNNPAINLDMAEQDLVSCFLPRDPITKGGGCDGAPSGQIKNIFSQYYKNTGIAQEIAFPYRATNRACSAKASNWQTNAWKTLGYQQVDLTGDMQSRINNIKQAVVNYGPVEVGMLVYYDFFYYTSGIYQHTSVNLAGGHAVTVVGFGKYDGRDYYIIKNSWGSSWGENGYFRIFADDSEISSWSALAVTQPNPPQPQNILCTDNDHDGYCYWGLSATKPSSCPTSCSTHSTQDCDDSNLGVFQNCGVTSEKTGTLTVDSTPLGADVYIFNTTTGSWNYRGQTPLSMSLYIGNRQVKLSKVGFIDNTKTINITYGNVSNLNISLAHDPQYLYGWPVDLDAVGSASSPQVADIDGDGSKEIVVNAGLYRAYTYRPNKQHDIYVFDKNGNSKPGWPVDLTNLCGADCFSGPASVLVDLNNDGKLEIISLVFNPGTNFYGLYAWDYTGKLIPGWNINFLNYAPLGDLSHVVKNNYPEMTETVSDIDNDGKPEIIIAFDAHIFVFDQNGNIKTGWPQQAANCNWSGSVTANGSIAIGDLYNDNKKEIVYYCGTNMAKSSIYIFNSDGSISPGWPKQYLPTLSAKYGYQENLFIADMKNDGKKEIIFLTNTAYTLNPKSFYIHVIDPTTGSEKSGWPKTVDSLYHFSIGDINKDGYPEIVFTSGILDKNGYLGTTGNKLNVLKYNGTALSGWPIRINSSLSDVVIGDVNNDSYPDLIFDDNWDNWESNSDESQVYAYDYKGNVISGWPKKMTGSFMLSNPTIDDIDNNGTSELVALGLPLYWGDNLQPRLFIFDLKSIYNPLNMPWPTFMHDPQHTGCYDCGQESVPPACTSFIYSDWSVCTNGQQTRTVLTFYPSGCIGGSPVLSQSCISAPPSCPKFTPPAPGWCANGIIVSGGKDANGCALPPTCTPSVACTSASYSAWSACSMSGSQTRTVLSQSPAGCTITGLYLSRACTPSSGAIAVDSDVTAQYPDGVNPYLKGTCKDKTGSYTDWCGSGDWLNTVAEYRIDPSTGLCKTQNVIYSCKNEGKICVSGACVASSTTVAGFKQTASFLQAVIELLTGFKIK